MVEALKPFGALCRLEGGPLGLVPMSTLQAAYGQQARRKALPGTALGVVIRAIDVAEQRILFGLEGVEADEQHARDFQNYQLVRNGAC